MNSAGYNFNRLLIETIIELMDCNDQRSQLQTVLKNQVKKIEQFDVKSLSFNECVGYGILSKIYFILEKLKPAKLSPKLLNNIKTTINEKIKNGLKKFDHLQMKYLGGQVKNKKNDDFQDQRSEKDDRNRSNQKRISF